MRRTKEYLLIAIGILGLQQATKADEMPKIEPVSLEDMWANTSQSYWHGVEVQNLRDGNAATKFCPRMNGQWPLIVNVKLPLGLASKLTQYTFSYSEDVPARDPKNWILQGSNDGRTWSDVDQRMDQPMKDRLSSATFDVNTTTAFREFRFVFQSNHGDAFFQLSGIELKGTTTRFAAPDAVDRFEAPLPELSIEQAKAAQPLPAEKTTIMNHEFEWAFPGSLGPLGVMAQRLKQKASIPIKHRSREYRVLSIEPGSPASSKLLPGDFIVGLNGGLFSHDSYVNREVEVFKSYREPEWEMGRGIQKALKEHEGLLVLTVRRGERTGTVSVPLGKLGGFSSTYPWNCPTSQQLCKEIAQNYLKEHHGKQTLEPWRASWFGLFLLNHDPVKYRYAIDDIAENVRKQLNRRAMGAIVKGVWEQNSIWAVSAEAIFLAEYAIQTRQESALRHDLNRYAQYLLSSRMLGNLWGHDTWFNYGSMYGGFMGASSQAGLALLVLKEAGADISSAEINKIMDSLSASINRKHGGIDYSSVEDHRTLLPFDWKAIDANTDQVHSESIMRQGAVHLAMHCTGRMTEAEATFRFLRRQTAVFATHGMTQDAGVFDGARALAWSSPDDCRALLDNYLPRLTLSRRWNGGLRHTPSGRDPSGKDEYPVEERGIDNYIPAVMGLLLSMPEKRLFLFKGVLAPQEKPFAWPAREQKKSIDLLSPRHLTYGGDSAFFCAPDAIQPLRWAVYRQRFEKTGPLGKSTPIISNLLDCPYELHVWKGKLFIAGTGKEGSVMAWDISTGGVHNVLNTFTHSRASLFTEYADALYYISPQQKIDATNRYVGGELWKTADGLTAERIAPLPGGKPLWGILQGSGAWQTVAPSARSLQVVNLKAGPRLFIRTHECTGGDAFWAPPVPGTYDLWMSDGKNGTGSLLYRRPQSEEQHPGSLQVLAVDNNNSRIGSLIGTAYNGCLFFPKNNVLQVSNDEGSAFKAFEAGGLTFRLPNNFATFTHAGKQVLAFSALTTGYDRRLLVTDGTNLIANLSAGEYGTFNDIRYVTSVGNSLYFIGITPNHGAELWRSDGTQNGTVLVRDFEPGAAHSHVNNLTALNGKIYFTAWDERYGNELWRHDPATGTLMVADIVPGKIGSRPEQLQVRDNWLVFSVNATIGDSGVLRYSESSGCKDVSFAPVR